MIVGSAMAMSAQAAGAQTSPPPATPLRSMSVGAVIKALSVEGVGVYREPTSSRPIDKVKAPATPLRMLLSQAQTDAAQIDAGGGTSGAQLQTLVAMPANAPPFAYLMAAYASGGSTPGQVLAGQLTGSQALGDPETAVFPALVQTLFAADAARLAKPDRAAKGHRHGARMPRRAVSAGRVGAACTAIADWTSSATGKFFSAVTVGTPSNAGLAFLAGVWNRAVALASAAIDGITAELTNQVKSVIRNGLGLLGVASMAVSTLQNLRLTLSASPAANSFGAAPAGNPGTVTATLGKPGGIDYPSDLTECAKSVFKLDLPSLNDVSGSAVAWTVQTSSSSGALLATITNQQDVLGANHAAVLSYLTSSESPDQVARGALISTDYMKVAVSVTPTTFKKLLDLVDALTLGRLPGVVSRITGPIVRSLKAAVVAKIAALVDPSELRYIQITHHATPAALPAGSCSGLLAASQFPGSNQPETEFAIPQPEGIVASTCAAGYEEPDGGTEQAGQGTGGSILLEVAPTSALATSVFADDMNDSTAAKPVTGVGDEAFTSSAPPGSSPTGMSEVWVRVANDVFRIEFDAYQSLPANPQDLAPTVVSELCPLCRFPTSGP